MITKDQWAQLEKEMLLTYGRAVLRADGHLLQLVVNQVKPRQFAIAVYVDGVIKGEYMASESPIGAKFFRPRTRCAIKPADLKGVRKKVQEQWKAKYTFTVHDPFWTSVPAMRRHLTKTCQEIELVSCGYVAKEQADA